MHALTNTTPALDGFELDDEDGNNLIKGEKIKFTLDSKWVVARSGEVIDPRRKFLVIEILRVAQKWLPDENRPVETRILGPEEPFPDLKKLNAKAPQSEKSEKFGKLAGPYQGAHVVYLIEINAESKKVAAFTWIADIEGAGASRAIKELRESTKLTRRVQGLSNLFPVATLSDTFMPTQYGGRQRPHFEIVDYKQIGGQEQPSINGPKDPNTLGGKAAEPKQIEARPKQKAKSAKLIGSDDEPDFDDDINIC